MRLAAGLAAALLALWLLLPGLRETLRERAGDAFVPPVPAGPVLIVDIDAAALAAEGPWPWPRAALAELLGRLTAAGPAAIGLDILLAGPDRFAPAGDAALAARLGGAALGVALAPTPGESLPAAPLLVAGEVVLPGLWVAPGAVGPAAPLAAVAAGLGVMAFDPDADGRIRRAPLLALAGGAPLPGLAVEVARIAAEAAALRLAPGRLAIGEALVPLDGTARLRLRPASIPSLSAAAPPADLRGRLVLVGGSAPELGGLRPAAGGALEASVHLQARAVATVLAGGALIRPPWLSWAEAALAAALMAAAIALVFRLRPARAGLAFAPPLALAIAAGPALVPAGLLVDAAGPPLLGLLAFLLAALLAFVTAERRARALRARFAARLPPAAVAKLVAMPDLVRLPGEMRDITALFTDLEGFTALVDRLPPGRIVALLDAYLEAVTEAILAEGGTVEKIVGDGVHALFNAPLDLADHPGRALAAAQRILAATAALSAAWPELGRTRIGIESGAALVGDVGGARLAYTAHGRVMNLAARLEAANKETGTAVLIGPEAARRLPPGVLRPAGRIAARGFAEPVAVFAPLLDEGEGGGDSRGAPAPGR
jgi:adenylate cyclase